MPPRGGVKQQPAASSSKAPAHVHDAPGPSKLAEAGSLDGSAPFGLDEDQMAWASTDKTTWKGKGLTDDIKAVEVRRLCSPLARSGSSELKRNDSLPPAGQVAAAAGFPQGQGPRQAAPRVV
jgi:hypothetical protein